MFLKDIEELVWLFPEIQVSDPERTPGIADIQAFTASVSLVLFSTKSL